MQTRDAELQGKTIIVVGGTSGIGRAVAEGATTQGARVIVGSSTPEKLAEARARGLDARAVDVRDEPLVAAFFEDVGAFDHLVYTAGDWDARGGGLLSSLDLAAAHATFAVRFWGALAVIKHAQPHIAADGSITLTDGMIAHRPRAGATVSTAMAGAIEHVVRGLAIELAPVRVNAVCPGYIDSGIWSSMASEERAERLAQLTKRFPLARPGKPQEAAEAYLYLIRASYTTGQVLEVDGGMGLV